MDGPWSSMFEGGDPKMAVKALGLDIGTKAVQATTCQSIPLCSEDADNIFSVLFVVELAGAVTRQTSILNGWAKWPSMADRGLPGGVLARAKRTL